VQIVHLAGGLGILQVRGLLPKLFFLDQCSTWKQLRSLLIGYQLIGFHLAVRWKFENYE
jgi:hypothetical protein